MIIEKFLNIIDSIVNCAHVKKRNNSHKRSLALKLELSQLSKWKFSMRENWNVKSNCRGSLPPESGVFKHHHHWMLLCVLARMRLRREKCLLFPHFHRRRGAFHFAATSRLLLSAVVWSASHFLLESSIHRVSSLSHFSYSFNIHTTELGEELFEFRRRENTSKQP